MSSKNPPTDNSHFVPYQIVNALDSQRRGAPYSDETNRKIEKCLDSAYNTSETTVNFNRGLNKRHENQLTKYATGELEWRDLTPGAQNRYFQQAEAWKDIKAETNIQKVSPALVKELNYFYNPGNKHWKCHRFLGNTFVEQYHCFYNINYETINSVVFC